MSKIGRQPIAVPAEAEVAVNGPEIAVKGPRGELRHTLPEGIEARLDGARLEIARRDDSRRLRSLHGLSRTLVANMVAGVTAGYRKELVIEGTGFRAQVQDRKLLLWLGFASAKEYAIPEAVSVAETQGTRLTVEGIDKQLVGHVAASIRAHFPAEPYTGKGIRYAGEQVRRKQGKTVA